MHKKFIANAKINILQDMGIVVWFSRADLTCKQNNEEQKSFPLWTEGSPLASTWIILPKFYSQTTIWSLLDAILAAINRHRSEAYLIISGDEIAFTEQYHPDTVLLFGEYKEEIINSYLSGQKYFLPTLEQISNSRELKKQVWQQIRELA